MRSSETTPQNVFCLYIEQQRETETEKMTNNNEETVLVCTTTTALK